MNSKKNGPVLIIGCGWLGKKLASYLISKKITVYGTTRSSSNFSTLNALDIKPVKLELPATSLADIRFPDVKTVIISISPGRGENRNAYPKIIGQLSQVLAEKNVQIIMYSSTSVYGNLENKVIESDVQPNENSDNAVTAAEGMLVKYSPDAVILRLSGLYGEDRHPARFMAGRKDIAGGDSPVNLVHRDDVIQVTSKIIEKNIKGEIFNVCSEGHPSRSEIYTTIAERLELKKPTFKEGGADGKKVSSEKLIKQLKFKFAYPKPSDFLAN